MTKESNLHGSDLSKAIKFICKREEVAGWVREVMQAALRSKPSAKLEKFANQQLKNLGARAEKPAAPRAAGVDEAGLLRAIAAKPDDDAPRLVYADFLIERGIGWGEVIRLSLPPPEFGTPEDEQLERLKKKHLKAWLEPIRPFITSWSISRGLLDFVDTQVAKFLGAADAISLRAPRGTLMLGGLKAKELPQLAATPLGRFREVRLSEQRLDDAQLTVLAASPSIAGVEEWDLGGNHFGDEGVKALAASPHFAACKALLFRTLELPTMTSAALAAVLSSEQLPLLEQVTMDVTGLEGAFDGCRAKLSSLGLSTSGTLTDETLRALARAGSLAGLTHLALGWNSRVNTERLAAGAPFSDAALEALVDALPALKSLTVPGQLPARVVERLRARLG